MAKWDKPALGPGPGGGGLGGGPQPIPIQTGTVPTNALYGSDPEASGVTGDSNSGPGVLGRSLVDIVVPGSGASDGVLGESNGTGVHGITRNNGIGVYGESREFDGTGVSGSSAGGDGVHGVSTSNQHAAVSAVNDTPGFTSFGVYARGSPAAYFDGNVTITGNLNIGSQGDIILSDCAEHFDAAGAEAGPGTVMIINRDGDLQPCSHAYDKKVAGVVSGAGNFKPGIILGRQKSQGNALLISLVGKVYCNVDAQYSPIEVGDLLTTSPTPGHAMKAADPWKAFGCVIGKALRPVDKGQRLIPILISLQ